MVGQGASRGVGRGDRLRALVEPAVEALGYEFVGMQFVPRRTRALLRIYVDSDDGVTLEDCARVSEQVGALLDVEDPIEGAYSLEVSSPGEDRPLFTERHFERYRGARVRVKMSAPLGGRRNFTGTLAGMRDGEVVVTADDGEWALPLESISIARLVPEP